MSLSSSSNPGPGPLLVPSELLVVLLLLPILAALLARFRKERAAPRAVAAALLGSAAVTAYLLGAHLGWGGRRGGPAVELVQPLWRVLAVQRLELAVGLGLDGPAAALLLGLALLGGGAASGLGHRRAAWLGAAYGATAVALLGDTLVLRLVGWELLTVAGWGLSARRGQWPLGLARAADATLLLATALLFWALAGSWSSSRLDARYQLDRNPPSAPEGAVAAPQPEPGPSLELRQLHHQLHGASSDPTGAPARAALANKLGPGARLLTWLSWLFGLAAALKAGGGALQLLTERGQWGERGEREQREQREGWREPEGRGGWRELEGRGGWREPEGRGGWREPGERRGWRDPVRAAAVQLFLLAAPLAVGWDLLRRLR